MSKKQSNPPPPLDVNERPKPPPSPPIVNNKKNNQMFTDELINKVSNEFGSFCENLIAKSFPKIKKTKEREQVLKNIPKDDCSIGTFSIPFNKVKCELIINKEMERCRDKLLKELLKEIYPQNKFFEFSFKKDYKHCDPTIVCSDV